MLLKSLDLSEFSDVLDISGEVERFDYVDFSDDVVSLINNIETTKKFDACIEIALQLHREHKPVVIWCIFIDSMMNIMYFGTSRGSNCMHLWSDLYGRASGDFIGISKR